MTSVPVNLAPFPYFGGKSRVADVVWRAFGDAPKSQPSGEASRGNAKPGSNDRYASFAVMISSNSIRHLLIRPSRCARMSGLLCTTLGRPPSVLAGMYQRSGSLFAKLLTVRRKVFLFGDEHKVVNGVIEFVMVKVMNAHAARYWPVVRFPHDLRAQLPYIRVGNLYPCALFSVALMPSSNAYSSDGKMPSRSAHKLSIASNYAGGKR